MDTFEKVGYTCLGFIAVLYVGAMFVGMLAAFPFGVLGLIVLLGIGVLVIKVVKERLQNKEDDYYSDKVER